MSANSKAIESVEDKDDETRHLEEFLAHEVERAIAKFPNQALRLSDAEWLAVVTEEVGEAARDVNDHAPGGTGRVPAPAFAHLRSELIQIAAMAFRWWASTIVRQPFPNHQSTTSQEGD